MKLTKKQMALLTLALISMFIAGAIASYVWYTINITVEVKEPLEITSYPKTLSLYAGDNTTLSINITNYAQVNYLVTMEFALDNATYEETYVEFSGASYIVVPGNNTLTAWIKIGEDAPPKTVLALTVDFTRSAPVP